MQPASFPPDDVRMAFERAVYEVTFPEGPREFFAGAQDTGAPPFVVLTAWNPAAVELCVDENVARHAGLRGMIEARGWHWLPAESRAPDGTHLEPAFAILDVPPGEVADLAALFGQAAVFVWDGAAGRIAWLRPDPDLANQIARDDNHGG